MADINEIRRSLCSDKITIRKKGKSDCESLLGRDKTVFASNHVQTMEFVRALMEYEVKEIDAGQAKGKKLNLDVSVFVKKMVKYCITYGQIVSVKVTILLEHILNILYDHTLPPVYKNEHRLILCDLLEPRNTHSIPFDKKDKQLHVGLNKLFLYLRDVMTDSRSTSDSNNLKLLRLLCRSLFTDNSNHPESILKYLMQWFNDLLKTAAETAATSPQLSACLADCCRYFVEYQGVNLALTMFESVGALLQLVIKQLSTHQFRETHRTAFVKFLLRLMDFSNDLNWKYFTVLPPANPLCKHVVSLCEVVCSDDSLRALLLFANSTLQTQGGSALSGRLQLQARDMCPCLLDDPKVLLNYELIARASYHHQALRAIGTLGQRNQTVAASQTPFLSDILVSSSTSKSGSSSSSSSSSRAICSEDSTTQQSAKRQRTQPAATVESGCVSPVDVDTIFHRLCQARGAVAMTGVRSGATQTQPSSTSFGTQIRSQGGSTQSLGSSFPSSSRQASVQLHDSLVYVAIVLFRQYPRMDFLSAQCLSAPLLSDTTTDCRREAASRTLLLNKLFEWVDLFRGKLVESLQLSGAVDFAHCGLLLMALSDLARVTHVVLQQQGCVDNNTSVRGLWHGVVSLLLESRALVRLASSSVCRRNSVTDRQLTLLGLVTKFQLVETNAIGRVHRLLWTTASATDPSLADSPEVFNFLCCLSGASREDVPSQMCVPFLLAVRERLSDDADANSIGGGVDQYLGVLMGLAECSGLVPIAQFVALWLMDGLQSLLGREAGGSSRMTMVHCHSFNVIIRELLLTQLSYSRPKTGLDIVEASRNLGQRGALHWLEPSADIATDEDVRAEGSTERIINQQKQSRFDKQVLSEGCAHSLALLDCVRDKLLSMRVFVAASGGGAGSSTRRPEDEFVSSLFAVSGDGASGSEGLITPWQVTSAMLLNTYAAVSEAASNVNLKSESTQHAIESAIMSFLQLLHANLIYLQNRVLLTKPGLLADFMCEIAFTIQCVAEADSGAFAVNTERKRKQCCDLLDSIMHALQRESTNNKHGTKGGEELDDLDFDRDERSKIDSSSSSSQGAKSSRARRVNTDTFAVDDDEDFMDGPVTVSATPSSHVAMLNGRNRGGPVAQIDPDSDMDDDPGVDGFVQARRGGDPLLRGFSGKTHSVYSIEHLRALSAAMQSVLLLSTSRLPVAVTSIADKMAMYLSVMEENRSGGGGGADGRAVGQQTVQSTRLITPSEVYLTIAQQLALLRPTPAVVATIRSMVDRCPWHIEWGSLGYCRVLSLIQRVTASDEFWKDHRPAAQAEDEMPDDVVQYFMRLTLPQDDKVLEPFPAAQFQVRLLQLECVANLMLHGGEARVATVKQSITSLFVSAVADRDLRVRLSAARKLPLLLTHFKKPDKVYEALVTATQVPLQFVPAAPVNDRFRSAIAQADSDEEAIPAIPTVDPLLTMTTAVCIARMGCSQVASTNVSLTRRALLDLMVLCCSRYKRLQPLLVHKPPNVGATQQSARASQHTQPTGSGSGGDEMTVLLHGCLDYRDLLFRLIAFMTRNLGYSCSSQLLGEYLRWLLYQWLVAGDVTGSDRDVDEETRMTDSPEALGDVSPLALSLSDFPYQLFLSTEQKASAELGFTFAQFLASHSDTILPLLAAITNHRLRWSLLQQFVTDCGLEASDRGMVQVIRQNISAVKALEFSVFFAGMSRAPAEGEAECLLYSEAMRTCEALQQFVSRNLNSAEMTRVVSTKISDTLQALFLLQTFERAAVCEKPLHEADGGPVSVDASEAFLLTVLTKICDMVEVTRIDLLLVKCNLLELLAALRNRLLQTRLPTVCRAVLAAVRLVVKNVPILSSACFNTVLSIVKVAADCYPGEVLSAASVLNELVISLCRETQVEASRSGSELSVHANAPHLFAELVILLAALAQAAQKSEHKITVIPVIIASSNSLNSNMGGRLKRTRAVMDDDCFFEEEDDLVADRHDQSMGAGQTSSQTDAFLDAYCAALKEGALSVEDLAQTRTLLNDSLVKLWRFMQMEGRDSVLAACLPLPVQYAVHIITEEVREEVSSALWCTMSLGDRTRSFVSLAGRILNGESFELSILWIELLNFRDALEGRAGPMTHSSPSHGFWKGEPELAATCVSSLLGICEHHLTLNHKHDIVETGRNVVREISVQLLGHIGPPDLFSLSHGAAFPARIGDIARDCAYCTTRMKLSLVQRIFGLLSAVGGKGYMQASQCLRVLSAASYFAEAEGGLSGCLAGNRHMRDIMDAYKISVQPRHQAVRPGATSSSDVDQEVEEAFSDQLWSTESGGATYEQWVTRVAHRLVVTFYTSEGEMTTIAKKQNLLITKSSDIFLGACAEVCLLRVDVAETVFQLVVADLLAVNGAQSYLCDKLSQYIRQHMLSPQCAIQRVTQLGCQTLTLLLRQEVAIFVDRSQKKPSTAIVDPNAIAVKPKRLEPSKTNDDCDWRLPFSYILNIDYHFAATAATRCQSVCSALLFAELGAERGKHSCGTGTASKLSSRSGSGGLTRPALRGGDNKADLNALLIPIYRGLHDPDALHGVADTSVGGTNLSLQAVMYEHEGRWMEALSTYESIIQSRVNGRIDCVAEAGVLRALEGLGAQYTLNHLQNSHCDQSSVTSYPTDSASVALQTWSSALQSGSDDRKRKGFPRESVEAPHSDALSACISSAVQDLTQRDTAAALQRVAASTRLLLSDMASRSGEQCAHNIVGDLAQAQQLREIVEACCVLDRSNGSSSLSSEHLLRRWQLRDGDSSGHPQQQALRFTLLSHLLRRDALTAPQAVDCLTAVLTCVKSRDTAHSVSPLVYKYWNLVNDHVSRGRVDGRTSDTLSLATGAQTRVLQAQWALYECKLLWRKGLKEVAVANITTKVVGVLRDLLPPGFETSSGDGSTNSSSSNSLKVFGGRGSGSSRGGLSVRDDSRVRNLLSEALRVGGEWMSTKRAATGTEILEDFLVPAASFAEGVAEKIRAHETLGGFNSRLHQNVKNKIASAEWKQGARVLADREAELEQCRAMQVAERLTRDPKVGPTADTKALYRHTAVLKKEVELDTRERHAVEASEGKYLLAAIRDYGQVLTLSTDESLDAVFRVVNLWLSHSESAHVNDLVDELLQRVASYKFVPLTYQVFSRLGRTISGDVSSPVNGEDLEPLHAVLKRNASTRSLGSAPGSASKKGASLSSVPLPKTKNELFQFVLGRMVFRLCAQHPHHTLAQLFALANEREMGASYDGAAQFKSNSSDSRSEAAGLIVTQLLANVEVAELVGTTQTLLLAYIELAKITTETFQKAGRTKDIKFKEIQSRGKRFNECLANCPNGSAHRPAVITEPLALSPLMDYRGVPRTVEFLPSFSITENGISRPKIISCLGSDGRWRKQLVKGGDDMRQDAVMEQVFEAVNHMLGRDDEAAKRALGVRTYKIVPTTPQTGVLQWVENTLPFGAILYDKESGTHNRYYSAELGRGGAVNDAEWSHGQCREHLKDAADNADKLRKFHEVMDHFHPSLRFFFLERYADPARWMASRLAYTRSVAVTSMVGYILGIGDRHAHNILVDTLTAEVVHIDFGIVYEQGKGLGAPETVPFRLTRDIVDGMGVTGVEGTFRRSCEEVLRVLRDNALQIMTILEVVIHDPLYKWSLSPLQARMKQNTVPDFQLNLASKATPQLQNTAVGTTTKQGGSFGKDAAERTLMRIKNKLHGYEDPTGEALSVEGLVDLLINEARSPGNLCRLFPGWAPWL